MHLLNSIYENMYLYKLDNENNTDHSQHARRGFNYRSFTTYNNNQKPYCIVGYIYKRHQHETNKIRHINKRKLLN